MKRGNTTDWGLRMMKARKMLNDWEAPYIQSLVKLVETQSKATLANWVVDYADECGRMLDALRNLAVENEPNPAKIGWKC
jgi:hypothetical protein